MKFIQLSGNPNIQFSLNDDGTATLYKLVNGSYYKLTRIEFWKDDVRHAHRLSDNSFPIHLNYNYATELVDLLNYNDYSTYYPLRDVIPSNYQLGIRVFFITNPPLGNTPFTQTITAILAVRIGKFWIDILNPSQVFVGCKSVLEN